MHLSKIISRLAIIASIAIIAVSCSKNDNPTADYNADKARLQTVIDSLKNVYNTTVEGTRPGQYVIGSRTALDSVIKLAMQVASGTTYTQQQVNNALAALITAGNVFQTELLQEVSVANLMALWKFSGNALDSSGRGHNGTLQTGYLGSSATTATDGGILPRLVPDRFGRANMAYEFNNAANIEVPYSADLNPQSLTICAWVKRYTTNSNNYIISFNRWNGYKYQLQSNSFLFFTFKDNTNTYHDIDNNPGAVPEMVWTHTAVAYTNGAIRFYVDGVLTKTIAVTGTPASVPSTVNLAIGNELPKSGYNLTNSADPNYYYGPSFFIGALDDIRIYNTALSSAEILSIYTQEKSL